MSRFGTIEHCPSCQATALLPVTDGEVVNFLCNECGDCWHIHLDTVHRVSPLTCPGCPHRERCESSWARDHTPAGIGEARRRKPPAIRAFAIAALAMAAVLGACSSGSGSTKSASVVLSEYDIALKPKVVKAGAVRLAITNVGSVTHELVIVRANDAATLPKVAKAGERSVGAVDEEAIAETDKMGESGDVAPHAQVTKTFQLKPGSYVLFCNIDDGKGAAVVNHYVKGMHALLVVQ